MEKGVDGFRIDAVPHIYEDNNFIDEPKSEKPGVNENEYDYLNHIYTKDDVRTYGLIRDWRKLLDDYANESNSDEKVLIIIIPTFLNYTNKFMFFIILVYFIFIECRL